jgi:hypothetical protein
MRLRGRAASPACAPWLVPVFGLLLAGSGGSSLSGSRNTTTEPRHALANEADTALSRTMLLRPADVGADWSFIDQSDYKADDLSTQSSCLADYPGYVAGSSVNYGFKVDPNGRGAVGQLGMDVRVTNSDADASKQYERLQSIDSLTAAAGQCFLESYRGIVAQAVGLDNLLPGSELLARGTPSVALKGLIFKASVPYRLNGTGKMMFIDEVRIQRGRIVARLLFMTCCKPFDYATVEGPFVNTVAKRVESA